MAASGRSLADLNFNLFRHVGLSAQHAFTWDHLSAHHAFTWEQQAGCPSLLHSKTHSRRNHQCTTVPYCSSDTRHWDQSFATSTFSNPSQINFLATGTLAANDCHSALPTPVRLLIYSSCFSWSRWCMCFYPIHVPYLLHCRLYLSLELLSKGRCAQF